MPLGQFHNCKRPIAALARTARQTKVRLAEINTPESSQPYGSRAKQAREWKNPGLSM
jgi:endonuclease YncB( thermonuclease family)